MALENSFFLPLKTFIFIYLYSLSLGLLLSWGADSKGAIKDSAIGGGIFPQDLLPVFPRNSLRALFLSPYITRDPWEGKSLTCKTAEVLVVISVKIPPNGSTVWVDFSSENLGFPDNSK